jgi:hypothetical protein
MAIQFPAETRVAFFPPIQGRLQALFHKPFPEAFDSGDAHIQGVDNLRIRPGGAAGTLIGFQQNPSAGNFPGPSMPRAH